MKIELDKQLILEGFILDKIQNFIRKIKNKFFGGYKYLNENDLESLLEFIYWHYYKNFKVQNDFFTNKKNKNMVDVLEKIKKNTTKKFPSKLYRGMSFKNDQEYNDFLNSSKKYGVSSFFWRTKKPSLLTSWTSKKKIAEMFWDPNGFGPTDNKIGVLITVDYKDYKDKFVFSSEQLMENINEKKEFVSLILSKEFDKNMNRVKKVKDFSKIDPHDYIGNSHGSLYSVMEHEYILKSIPFDRDIDIYKFKIDYKQEIK